MRDYINILNEAATKRAAVLKPPSPIVSIHTKMVFLGGAINMGKTVDWQAKVSDDLADLSVTFLNPRRDDWDSNWVQDISNPEFKRQVDWELNGLELADLIVIYFDKDGESPISLLELGLYARKGNMIVCCEEGFWRRGNVQIVCDRFDIPLVETLEEMTSMMRERLETVSG